MQGACAATCRRRAQRQVLGSARLHLAVGGVDMAADIFTKPVEKAKFIRMRDYIMNVHSVLRGSIEDAMVCAVGASHRMMNNLLRRL